jgi:UDP-3-O-[3-hydroxymyristoyl] glucosamine N-acyltransferase
MRNTSFYWEDFQSKIASDAYVHPKAHVAPKNVRIASGTVIEANATIHERCIIGSGSIIRSGCVIGGEGFEPKWVGGRHINVPHAGGVLIGDRVESCRVHRSRLRNSSGRDHRRERSNRE